MVDDVVDKNLLTEERFKTEFYHKYVADIISLSEYKELQIVAKKNNLQILFSYYKSENWFDIQYDIRFDICDESGKIISVPRESKYWDYLYNLFYEIPVVIYKRLTKKIITLKIDEKEISKDLQLLIEYLKCTYEK